MKIVFTGDTSLPRELLIRQASDAGLDVMNSVSSRTSLLVCNSPSASTRKAQLAHQHQTPRMTEAEFAHLLTRISPGEPKAIAPATPVQARPAEQTSTTVIPRGQLADYRVLVLGGTHDQASEMRSRVAALGAQTAANLTATVTHTVALPGHRDDPRWSRAQLLSLPALDPETLEVMSVANIVSPIAAEPMPYVGRHWVRTETVTLPRGGVTDLDPDVTEWSLAISWPDHASPVDVVAFVVDDDEQVATDDDFCFYNNPHHPSGTVALDLDTPNEATAELRLARLPSLTRRIVIAAAVAEPATFGQVGPIELALRDDTGIAVRATLDAADQERTLLLANIYERNGTWRFRAIGQGYRTNLATLAVAHGVDVAEE